MRIRLHWSIVLALCVVCLTPTIAQAAVTYSDWRWSTTSVFVKYGNEFTQLTSGGYNNSATLWICYPANGWSYVHLHSTDEYGKWIAYNKTNFNFGEWQAYITSSGTDTRAQYNVYSHNPIVNQYAYHGFTTIASNGHYSTWAYLYDDHDGYNYSSGQKCAWDAVRFYY